MSGSPRTSSNQMKSDKFEGRPRKLLARKFFLIFCWPRLEKRWEDCQILNFSYKKLVRRIHSDKRIQILVHNLFIGAEATQHEEKKRRDQNQSGLFSGHQKPSLDGQKHWEGQSYSGHHLPRFLFVPFSSSSPRLATVRRLLVEYRREEQLVWFLPI